MPFSIRFTESAEQDLEDIYLYVSSHDSPEKAYYVIEKIEERIMSLAELPERGFIIRELSTIGISDYREIFFKPYRIIYKIIDDTAYIMIIADGRRDMQTLLQRMLIRY